MSGDAGRHRPVLARPRRRSGAAAAPRRDGARPTCSSSAAGSPGLWTALQAAEEGKSVVLLEGERLAFGASGRNGGFCDASLTHGLGNGLQRWPGEMEALERHGPREPRGDRGDDRARTGSTAAGSRPGRSPSPPRRTSCRGWRRRRRRCAASAGTAELLDADGVRAQVDSPDLRRRPAHAARAARSSTPRGCAGAWRARRRRPGRRSTRARRCTSLRRGRRRRAGGLPGGGVVRARRALLATAAFPPLVRAIRRYVVPVYDYVLVTEPLSEAQRDAIGWRGREGLSDVTNQFHYYRQTDDHRILWGGYDAVYDFGGRVTPERDARPATFARARGALPRDVPAARRARLLAPLGRRDRHLQPLQRAVGDGARRPRGLRRRLHRARASAPRASAPASASTCSTASTRSAPGWRWCAGGRSRSRPSPCAGRASRSRAARSRAPTAARAAAGRGCGRWTGWASASIPDGRYVLAAS